MRELDLKIGRTFPVGYVTRYLSYIYQKEQSKLADIWPFKDENNQVLELIKFT